MKWGKVIQRRVDAEPEWAPYYVNYKKLKAVVRDVAAAAAGRGGWGGATDEWLPSLVAVAADATIDDVPVESKVAVLRLPPGTAPGSVNAVAARLRRTSVPFINELSAQITKLSAFYTDQVRTFSRRLDELSSVAASGTDSHTLAPTLASLRDSVSDLAEAASVNATSVDKILKKHDKATRSALRFTFVGEVLAHQPFVASVTDDMATLRHLLATVVVGAPDGAGAPPLWRSAPPTPRVAVPQSPVAGDGGPLQPFASPPSLHADDDGVFDTDDGAESAAAGLHSSCSPAEGWGDPDGAARSAADREVLASLSKAQSARRVPRALNNDVPAEAAKRRPPRRRESLCVVLRGAADAGAFGSRAEPGGPPCRRGMAARGGGRMGQRRGRWCSCCGRARRRRRGCLGPSRNRGRARKRRRCGTCGRRRGWRAASWRALGNL
eukprot:TRINITY_DN2857_c0_g3_i2.p1 TRINITY_DN2857_c0_g3~~TRINITY_DN2857_c0_g3_i2.p1  ORF type:complete len:475 (+),score=123.61 TRINITY_DN2857_c0_g3_i2:114-1427(+)